MSYESDVPPRRGPGRPRGARNKSPRPATEARQLTLSRELWTRVDSALMERSQSRTQFFEQAVLILLNQERQNQRRDDD